MEKKLMYIQLFGAPVISLLMAIYLSVDDTSFANTIKIFVIDALVINIGIMSGCAWYRKMEDYLYRLIRLVFGLPAVFWITSRILFIDIMEPPLYEKESLFTFLLVIILFSWISITLVQSLLKHLREDRFY